ncbi:hypothetical protein HELRODRAFT_164612 [Helobdella robusta]|uniref:Phosphatase and actin regulator n=1 Tax=Helobdella robusta TaxID=6412 RepID=T1EVN0_HELRO|nr:hypothetical protein HELRODRAFT_164612 [Helobdella robusta]ESN92540.1 hypothetical protein HELRODRAFT_164612 [Helobdella robusta]
MTSTEESVDGRISRSFFYHIIVQFLIYFKGLNRRLKLRRTIPELVNQGIYPKLNTPMAFTEQLRHLEQAKARDSLQKKLKLRPDRDCLVQHHILEDTHPLVDRSLQDKQKLLKKFRLQDNLNDLLSHRPGPLDLLSKNILLLDEDASPLSQNGDENAAAAAAHDSTVSPPSNDDDFVDFFSAGEFNLIANEQTSALFDGDSNDISFSPDDNTLANRNSYNSDVTAYTKNNNFSFMFDRNADVHIHSSPSPSSFSSFSPVQKYFNVETSAATSTLANVHVCAVASDSFHTSNNASNVSNNASNVSNNASNNASSIPPAPDIMPLLRITQMQHDKSFVKNSATSTLSSSSLPTTTTTTMTTITSSALVTTSTIFTHNISLNNFTVSTGSTYRQQKSQKKIRTKPSTTKPKQIKFHEYKGPPQTTKSKPKYETLQILKEQQQQLMQWQVGPTKNNLLNAYPPLIERPSQTSLSSGTLLKSSDAEKPKVKLSSTLSINLCSTNNQQLNNNKLNSSTKQTIASSSWAEIHKLEKSNSLSDVKRLNNVSCIHPININSLTCTNVIILNTSQNAVSNLNFDSQSVMTSNQNFVSPGIFHRAVIPSNGVCDTKLLNRREDFEEIKMNELKFESGRNDTTASSSSTLMEDPMSFGSLWTTAINQSGSNVSQLNNYNKFFYGNNTNNSNNNANIDNNNKTAFIYNVNSLINVEDTNQLLTSINLKNKMMNIDNNNINKNINNNSNNNRNNACLQLALPMETENFIEKPIQFGRADSLNESTSNKLALANAHELAKSADCNDNSERHQMTSALDVSLEGRLLQYEQKIMNLESNLHEQQLKYEAVMQELNVKNKIIHLLLTYSNKHPSNKSTASNSFSSFKQQQSQRVPQQHIQLQQRVTQLQQGPHLKLHQHEQQQHQLQQLQQHQQKQQIHFTPENQNMGADRSKRVDHDMQQYIDKQQSIHECFKQFSIIKDNVDSVFNVKNDNVSNGINKDSNENDNSININCNYQQQHILSKINSTSSINKNLFKKPHYHFQRQPSFFLNSDSQINNLTNITDINRTNSLVSDVLTGENNVTLKSLPLPPMLTETSFSISNVKQMYPSAFSQQTDSSEESFATVQTLASSIQEQLKDSINVERPSQEMEHSLEDVLDVIRSSATELFSGENDVGSSSNDPGNIGGIKNFIRCEATSKVVGADVASQDVYHTMPDFELMDYLAQIVGIE